MSVSEFISDVSINGGLSVASDTSLNGSLFVRDSLNVGDGGTIAGLTSFTGIVTYDNFMISNATNQMNGSTTYNGNTTFAGKLTANEMTINEAFIAKKDAIYQSNMQVSNDLNVIARSFLKKDVEVLQGNVTVGKNIVTSGNITAAGNAIISGDLSLNGKLSAAEVDVTLGPNSVNRNAIINRNDFSSDASGLIVNKIGLDNSVVPKVTIDLSGATDAIKLPRGTTAERPDLSNNDQGYIRYNAETSQFEGYGAGGAWGSLGGVTDVDQDTFVSAENAAGEDNDELKFFTAGSERMVIDACGNIGIKNSTPTVTLDLSGATDAVKLPIGSTAHRPDTSGNDGLGYIRYNTETSQFEGYGAGNTWGSLGGVTDVDQDTKIVAEVSAGADNDALQFITAGSERLTITSEGDLSLNKSIVLNKKLPIGMSEASFVTVTPTQASLAAASWSTTTNGVDVNWNVTSSSFLVNTNGQYPSYYVFDASFGNTLDTSTLSTDSSGNFVDASGVIVRDASGNTLDASGDVIEVNTEFGYLTEAPFYNSVTGAYEGFTNTNVEVIGDVSGEYIEITSDVSFNISSFHFKAVDYLGFLGAHLLPKKFTFAGYDENSTTYKPIMRVTHSGAPTDNSFNAVTDEYTKFTTTDVSANDLGIGIKTRDVEYYSTSSGVYKKYRLIIEEKSNTTSDYTDVINRSFAGIGEWVITGTSPDPSTIVFTYEDSSANITMNGSSKDTLNLNGNVKISDNLSVGGVITVGGKIFLEDTVLSGDISLNDTLIVGGEIQVDQGLIVKGDASLNAGLVVSDDVSMNSGLSVGGEVSLNNKLKVTDNSGVVLTTSIIPETDNTISLGSGDKRFKELHVTETVIGTDTLNFFSAAAGKVVGSLSFDTSKNVLDLSANGKVGESALLYNSKLSVGKSDNSSPQHELDVSGSALITGAAALSSTLDVAGATVLDNTVNVTGAAALASTIDVAGASTFGGNLNVNSGKFSVDATTGNTTVAGLLNITGTGITNSGAMTVQGNADLQSDVSITGAATVGGTLGVTGASTIGGNLNVNSGKFSVDAPTGNTTVAGLLNITGTGITNSGAMTVQGNADLQSDVSITGAATVGGATTLNDNVTVAGTTTLNDNVSVADSKTFTVGTGASSLGGSLTVEGETIINHNLFLKSGGTNKIAMTNANGNLKNSGYLWTDSQLIVGDTDKFSVLGSSGNTEIGGTLDVAGASTLGGTLDVTGASTMASTLDVTGEATFSENVNIADTKKLITGTSSVAQLGGSLTVAGETNLNENAYVAAGKKLSIGNAAHQLGGSFNVATGASSKLGGTLDVTGATTMASTIDVAGASTFGGNLNVNSGKFSVDAPTGNTTVAGLLNITGTGISNSGAMTVQGNADLQSDVSITGAATVGGTLGVTGEATFSENVNIADTKKLITGTSSVAQLGGSLVVAGETNLNENAYVAAGKKLSIGNGAHQLGGIFNVATGASSVLGGTLDVTGATTMAGPLDLNSTADINDTLTLSKSGGVGLDVASKATIGGDLDVSGKTAITENLDVSGAAVVDGTMKIGGETTVSGSIIPDVDNVYSLGTPTKRFSSMNVTSTTIGTSTLNFFSPSQQKIVGALSFNENDNVLDLSANSKLGKSALLYNSKLAVGNADNSSPTVEMDVTGDAAVSNKLTVGGDVSMNNDVSIEGTLHVKGAVNLTEYNNEYITNIDTTNYTLIVSEDLSLNGRMYVHDDASFNKNVFIKDSLGIGIGEPVVSLDVSAVDAIKLPKGTTAERPTANAAEHKGYIRYNAETDQFEGYGAGNAWGSLGGVIDVDQDTKITAETTANADNDELRFFTAGVERMRVKDNGDVSMNHDLSLQGAAKLASTLDVSGATVLDNTVNVTGAATLGSTLDVAGVATFQDSVVAESDLSANTTASIGGAATLGSTLDVAGVATFQDSVVAESDLSANTTASIGGAATLGSTLDVSGVATFRDSVVAESDLSANTTASIGGAATLGSTLDVSGVATFQDSVVAESDLSANTTASIGGAATLGSTLDVSGVATFRDSVVAESDLSANTTASFGGAVSANSSLTVTGLTNLIGDISLNGKLIADSDISLNKYFGIKDYVDGDVIGYGLETGNSWALATNGEISSSDSVSNATKVAMSDNGFAAFNSSQYNGGQGGIGVYQKQSDDSYTLQTTLTPDSTRTYANFFSGLTMSGNGAVIVSQDLGPSDDNKYGRMVIFRYDGTSWNRVNYLNSSPSHPSNQTYYSLDVNYDGTVIIGANYRRDGATAALVVLEYDGTSWSEKGDPTSSISDLAGSPYYNHGLGVAVNRGGNIIAVGAPGHYTSMAGGMDFSYQQQSFVRVMQYNDSNSTWETYGNDITGSNFECMGWSLALNSAGNRLVVGSPWYNMDRTTTLDANIQNYLATGMGRVQVFELTDNTWVQIGEFLGTTMNEQLGTTVCINDDGDVIGFTALEYASGYNTEFNSNGYFESYKYNGTTWEILGARITPGDVNSSSAMTSSNRSFGKTLAATSSVNEVLFGTTYGGRNYLINYPTVPIYEQLPVYGETGGNLSVAGTLDVSGVATFKDSIIAKSDISANTTASFGGAVSMNSRLDVGGDVSLNEDLTVAGATVLDSTLDVSGAAALASSLDVSGAAALASTLDVSGATVLDNTLTVTGQTTFDNDVSLNARMDVSGDISFNSSVTITGGLTVDGAVKLTEINNEYVTNINTTNYDLIVTEDLSLNGVLTVGDDVSFNGGLFVKETAILGGDLSLNSNLYVNDDVSLNGGLFVKETAILGGDLSLNSNLYVNGDVSLNAGLRIQGSVELGGDMSFNSGISVQSDSSFNGRLFVADKLNVNGIAIGRALNDENSTTVVGNDAATNLSDTGGIHNTAIGFQSLKANFQEPYNTSVGSETLKAFNGGGTGQNTGIGAKALGQTTTGGQNIALGYEAGYDNKSGSRNIFIGNGAGVSDANGAMNDVVAIGYQAKATSDAQTYIKNDDIYFDVVNDISGTAGKLHIGMINFTPGGVTGTIPQSAISGLDGESQTTTGDHIIEGRAFVGTANPDGTSVFNHSVSVKKSLAVTENINGAAGMEIQGDASFNSNVSMAGVNNMLSFKTFSPVEVAGAISTTTSRDDPNYTGYVAVGDRLPIKTNIQFIKASTDGQHVMAYSTDAADSIMISNDYGITYSSKSIAALDNSTYKVNRRAAMSLNGQYMVIVGNDDTNGDGYIYHSSDFGASFTSSLSTSALTYTCVAMTGNGQNIFVGTNNEKLYTSTDFGASMNPHQATPLSSAGISGTDANVAGPNINWRHIITNNTGKYTIAFTDTAVFISNNDDNYNNDQSWHAPDVSVGLGFGSNKNAVSDLESAFMTDDGAFAFIATANNHPYRINSSTHFNVTNLPSSGTNQWINNSNWIYMNGSGVNTNDFSRHFMAATTNAGMDGKFFHIIDTVRSDEVNSSYDGLNSNPHSLGVLADPNDDTPKFYKALAISGNGAYTYAADENDLYVKQYNDGTTVQIETGEAFVLSKDMSLNERVFVNGDVIARAGFEVTSDVSFNSNLFIGGDVSMNSKLFVDGDVSMNSNLFLDGDASMNSSLFVGGDVSMNSKLFLDGDASMNSNLSVDGDASMNSSLFVGGDVSMDQKLAVKDSLVSDATLEHYKTGTTTFNVAVGAKSDYGHRYLGMGSNSGYLINGEMSPYINMMIGKTYTFVFENGYGSHPFKFYLDAEKSDPYTYNVTDNGSDTVSITVTSETPQILYYQCSAHPYMGNQIQVIGSKNFTGDSSFNAIKLPRGTTAERPEDGPEGEAQGYIRYNTQTSQFEGFGAGNAWGSLGGIIDVDGDTFIKAETAANDDNDQLQFFTDGENRMTITSTGDVSMNQKLILDGDASFNSNLSVNGTLNVTGAVNLTEYNNEYITNIDTTNYTLIVTEDLSLNGKMVVNGDASMNGALDVVGGITSNTVTAAGIISGSSYTINGSPVISGSKQFTGTDLELKNNNGDITLLATGESGIVQVDTINEITADAGVTIEQVVLKDDNVTAHTISATNYAVDGTNVIDAARGVVATGLELKDNNGTKLLADGDTGNTTISGALTLDLATGTALDVTADASVGGDLTLTGDLDANGTADIAGTLTLSKVGGTGLDVAGDALIKGSLTVGADGNEFTISEDSNENITLANTVQNKDVIFTANHGDTQTEFLRLDGSDGEIQVSKDIIPSSSSVSLGSAGNPFKDVYVSQNSIIFGDAGSNQVSKFAVDSATGQISIQKTDSTGANVDAPLQYLTQNNFATVTNLTATGTAVLNQTLRVDGDISANANMSLGGDLSLNGGIQIAGDISWNSANIPADSIPSSAIIGGVGSDNFTNAVTMSDRLTVSGDVSFNSGNFGVHGMVPGFTIPDYHTVTAAANAQTWDEYGSAFSCSFTTNTYPRVTMSKDGLYVLRRDGTTLKYRNIETESEVTITTVGSTTVSYQLNDDGDIALVPMSDTSEESTHEVWEKQSDNTWSKTYEFTANMSVMSFDGTVIGSGVRNGNNIEPIQMHKRTNGTWATNGQVVLDSSFYYYQYFALNKDGTHITTGTTNSRSIYAYKNTSNGSWTDNTTSLGSVQVTTSDDGAAQHQSLTISDEGTYIAVGIWNNNSASVHMEVIDSSDMSIAKSIQVSGTNYRFGRSTSLRGTAAEGYTLAGISSKYVSSFGAGTHYKIYTGATISALSLIKEGTVGSNTTEDQKSSICVNASRNRIVVGDVASDQIQILSLPTSEYTTTYKKEFANTINITSDNFVSQIDVSFNSNLYVAGDLSWNPASSIAANSIPQSAIIGGVGSNDMTGDVSITGDLSLNVDLNVGGHSFFGADVSFNSGINIAGDISWNSVNIPDNSIPQTAIIGGVGGNTIDGDLNVKTGFIKQF